MKTLLTALFAFIASATLANAATLVATSQSSEFGDFTLDFTDTNGNGLLDIGEIESFSGFQWLTRTIGNAVVDVNTVLDIAGIANYGTLLEIGQSQTNWRFRGYNDVGTFIGMQTFQNTLFTYDLTLDDPGAGGSTVIPLPASLPLLFGGLGLLWMVRRRGTV